MASADKDNVQEQLNAAVSEEQRTSALLLALRSETAPAQSNKKLDAATRSQLLSEWHDISAKLVGEGFISSHATQDKTRERIELERDLASQRERQTQLSSPVAGVVQQLAIHTTGGVVTSAQPLMIVVPDSPTVSAEVTIANLDIGFVNAGQMVEVKLETFPYTKYGTVSARVDVVTADAVTDEKKGSYYPALLTLSKRDMDIDGKRVPISPGMNITAEIKTGQRRIIEYLLSPVQRAGSESLRER